MPELVSNRTTSGQATNSLTMRNIRPFEEMPAPMDYTLPIRTRMAMIRRVRELATK